MSSRVKCSETGGRSASHLSPRRNSPNRACALAAPTRRPKQRAESFRYRVRARPGGGKTPGVFANHVARRFGQKEAAWFIKGNGTTQAEGVLLSSEVQEIETGTFINPSDLIDLFYARASSRSSRDLA